MVEAVIEARKTLKIAGGAGKRRGAQPEEVTLPEPHIFTSFRPGGSVTHLGSSHFIMISGEASAENHNSDRFCIGPKL